MNIDFKQMIAIIVAIITFLITYFIKKEEKRDELEKSYFELLLVPYINEYKKNKNINSIKFINKRYTRENYYIPSYIFYLITNNNKQLLHKVLVIDYKNKFPNTKNTILHTLNEISTIVYFIVIFIYLILSFVILFSVFYGVESFVSDLYYYSKDIRGSITIGNLTLNDFTFSVICILIPIIIFIVINIAARYFINIIPDEYATKISKIKKNINKKKKEYDKYHRKYYI
ncbi:hypothetical protein ACJDU8_17255 [Clostridium sp. WILCCON 0269]|uniref:Uncharacterized protein n=1 Tax=Candidatus Clostridium eludens TaxID=3381663 RepID=A0ABW8SML6_9CLOT